VQETPNSLLILWLNHAVLDEKSPRLLKRERCLNSNATAGFLCEHIICSEVSTFRHNCSRMSESSQIVRTDKILHFGFVQEIVIAVVATEEQQRTEPILACRITRPSTPNGSISVTSARNNTSAHRTCLGAGTRRFLHLEEPFL